MRVFTYSDMADLLYKGNDNGYIAVFRKGLKRVYTHTYRKEAYIKGKYKIESLEEGLNGYFSNGYSTDLYQSMNTFISRERTIQSLRYLNALYIDIDCYKVNMRKESVLYFLENDCYNSVIPEPSLVVDSGRGLYLIWLLEQVPSQALTLWNVMQNYLYNALKEFGADRSALDASRVLRVIGSYNTKSESFVKVVDFNNIRYALKDLKAEYLPKIKPKKVKNKNEKSISQTQKSKKIYYFNDFSLYKTRLEDLLKLAELREYDLSGRREIFLFIIRYYATLVYDEDEAEKLVFELNEKFQNPLPVNEIKSTYSNYINKYKYKNSTLIDLFDITQKEMQFMSSIISKEYKLDKYNHFRKEKRRNEEGLTQREVKKKEKLLNIVKGMLNGQTTKEISEEYNISLRIVQKYKKELNDNEELYELLRNEIQKPIEISKIVNSIKNNEDEDKFEYDEYFKEGHLGVGS